MISHQRHVGEFFILLIGALRSGIFPYRNGTVFASRFALLMPSVVNSVIT